MKGRAAAVVIAVAALLGPLAANAGGQQRVEPAPAASADAAAVPMREVALPAEAPYVREGWEVPGIEMPGLDDELVAAVHQDDDALLFDRGNELGSFHPAPKGGSAFFGVGRPIFGIAAPPILPSKILRPLGTGDAGDRFLGAPPVIPDDSVIPKIGETFDQRRHAFAFLGGVPPLAPDLPDDNVFPLPETVAADTNGSIPDNVPVEEPDTTTPTTTPPDRPVTPGTTPTTARPTTPTTSPSPGTTLPPVRTTTTTTPTSTTTTTTRPTTTTTSSTTTTSTTTSTTTTSTTTSTTTTTTPPPTTTPAPPRPSTSFVLGNQRESASYCLSNGSGGTSNDCDRLFDLSDIRPGQPRAVNVTLWNVDPDSDTDATHLKVFSNGACVSGTSATPAGSGNLCNGLQLKVERFATAARTGAPKQCIYGCGSTFGGSLNAFATSHGSWAAGAEIGDGFALNEKAYLVVTVLLPDTGSSASGRGNDNPYQSRTATLHLTWQMVSG